MSTDIAVRETPHASLTEKMEYAKAMAHSSLLPRQYQGNPANLLFALEYADALGVAPINAITSIHVIEGKPTASADLIAGLVRRAGHRLRVTGDDDKAVAQIIRADDPDFTYEAVWTKARAQQAGLTGKGVWKAYPGAMLRSRAITEVARMAASDALFGCVYTPEELGAEVDGDGTITATAVQQPTERSGTGRLRAAIAPAPAPEPEPAAAEPAPPTGEVHDAETVERPAEGLTAAQNRKIHALFRDLGMADDEHRQRAGMSRALNREVTSRKDLSKADAAFIIESLEIRLAQQQEQPKPADDVEWPEVAQPAGGVA